MYNTHTTLWKRVGLPLLSCLSPVILGKRLNAAAADHLGLGFHSAAVSANHPQRRGERFRMAKTAVVRVKDWCKAWVRPGVEKRVHMETLHEYIK